MRKYISLILILLITLSNITVFAQETTVPFSDVISGSWYEENVLYCFNHGYINGTSQGKFSPSDKLTRAMAVQILYSFNGDTQIYQNNPFSDVKEGIWYYNSTAWAVENAITHGTSKDRFSPQLNITRQDFISLLYRYSGMEFEGTVTDYNDADKISAYATDAMSWAISYGIISGYPDRTLRPGAFISRAEAVTIICAYDKELGHSWEIEYYSPRTCTAQGKITYICSDCTKTRTVILEAYHTWDKGSITKAPTCTVDGTKLYTCLSCQTAYTEDLPMTGKHIWSSKVTKPRTCFDDGVKSYTCTTCGKSYTEKIPKIGYHVYGDWVITKEASPNVTGQRIRYCKYCSKAESEIYRHWSYYQLQDKIVLPSGGYNVSTQNIGLKVIYTNYRLLGSTSASFTSSTKNAVINFQRKNGLPQTGVVDMTTWLMMGYSEYDWYNLAAYVTPMKVSKSASREAHIEAMISTAYEYAKAGTVYRIGASGTPGTYADCSGLIYQCLYSAGINPDTNIIDHGLAEYEYTSRWLAADEKLGLSVPVSERQRGDLVFYANNGTSKVIHVGIYAGDGMIYDAWPNIGTTYRSININGCYVVKVIRVFP